MPRIAVITGNPKPASRTHSVALAVAEALARELNGEIAHRFGPEGARSIVTFPNSAV